MEVCDIVQKAGIKTIPKKKAKWLSEEALQIAEKRKEAERQRRKGKIYPFECRVPRKSKERYENLPRSSMQRNRGKQ